MLLPVVVYLLRGVLEAARGHRPQRAEDRRHGGRRVQGPRRGGAAADDADQVRETVAGVANYGGSLDVIVDDAEPE